MTTTERLSTLLQKAKINARRVTVLGTFVHIDTFPKYRGALLDLMSRAGFALVMERDGAHMDSFDGYRLVFRLR